MPPCVQGNNLDIDETLTDLEMFKRYCLPIHDWWDDVPWHLKLTMVNAWEVSQFICMISKIFERVGFGLFTEVPKSNPQQYFWRMKKIYYPIASQVHMRETLEYFAQAKHIKIPHGWDPWLNMVGWLWICQCADSIKQICNDAYVYMDTYLYVKTRTRTHTHTRAHTHTQMYIYI